MKMKLQCLIAFLVVSVLAIQSIFAQEAFSEYSESPFGIHFDWIINQNQIRNIGHVSRNIKKLGVKNILVFIPWMVVEPSKGRFDWRIPDEIFSRFDGYETQFLVRLTAISDWGTRKGNKRAYGRYNAPNIPVDMDAYRNFLEQTVRRYHDRVKYWQIENEVYGLGEFWAGTPEEYLSLLKISYQAIKKVDRSARIIPAGIALGTIDIERIEQLQRAPRIRSALNFIDLVLSRGQEYFDMVDIHLYYTYESIEKRVKFLRNRMSQFGYEKPIICTEVGGPDIRAFLDNREFAQLQRAARKNVVLQRENLGMIIDRNPSIKVILLDEFKDQLSLLVAEEVIKRYVSCLYCGVRKVFWLLLTSRGGPDPLWEKMALVDRRGHPNAGFSAMKRMISRLEGFESIEKLPLGERSRGYVIARGTGKVYVVWSDSGEEILLDTPLKHVSVTDGIGNARGAVAKNGKVRLELNSMPIFIRKK
jgi:hypothetical protein